MLLTEPAAALAAMKPERWPVDRDPLPRAVFLIQPEGMWLSQETASDNRYMELEGCIDPERALAQHRALAQAIRAIGLPVFSFPGDPATPDAVFANNVFATAAPDRFIIGAMRHPGRQREAERPDIHAFFTRCLGYRPIDLRACGGVAELTGALVIDRGRGIGYCGLSERVDAIGMAAMHEAFDLRATLAFALQPGEYHTNVVMSVLASRALVLNAASIVDPGWIAPIAGLYGGRVLWLDDAEKAAFAGNCIALGDRALFLSRRAELALSPAHRRQIEDWGFELHAVDLDEIEKAGGSLRCCVAELY